MKMQTRFNAKTLDTSHSNAGYNLENFIALKSLLFNA